MKAFNYFSPTSIDEVLELLQRLPEKTRVLAGGTDLLVEMKFSRKDSPDNIISLKRVKELAFINVGAEGALEIGAATRLRDLETSHVIKQKFPAIQEAAASIGSVQIRNLGTIGGNIVRAAPSADMVPALVVYGAKVEVRSAAGHRVIPLEQFFVGPAQTVLQKDEIVTKVIVPPSNKLAATYTKLGTRNAMEIAIVGVAAGLELSDNVCRNCVIALGSVAPTVIRAKGAEAVLSGQPITEDTIERAAAKAMEECSPISDVRASASYRREMVKTLVKRTVHKLLQAPIVN